MEPFIGQIQAFGFYFAPRGWASCDGQLIAINQNTALFSLLGTTYGGDGRTTFALPDLRGRTMLSAGNGLGLSDRRLGSQGGSENNTLTVNQLPSHNHALGAGATVSIPVSGEDADQDEAAGKYLANGSFYHNNPDGVYGSGPLPLSGNTANQGGQQAFNNMQPYLVVNICIALQGIFPSRN
jgi:microcystin-dependent protein